MSNYHPAMALAFTQASVSIRAGIADEGAFPKGLLCRLPPFISSLRPKSFALHMG
jgi:hypothetical protein